MQAYLCPEDTRWSLRRAGCLHEHELSCIHSKLCTCAELIAFQFVLTTKYYINSLLEHNYLPSFLLGNSRGTGLKKEISLDRIACPCMKIQYRRSADSELTGCSGNR